MKLTFQSLAGRYPRMFRRGPELAFLLWFMSSGSKQKLIARGSQRGRGGGRGDYCACPAAARVSPAPHSFRLVERIRLEQTPVRVGQPRSREGSLGAERVPSATFSPWISVRLILGWCLWNTQSSPPPALRAGVKLNVHPGALVVVVELTPRASSPRGPWRTRAGAQRFGRLTGLGEKRRAGSARGRPGRPGLLVEGWQVQIVPGRRSLPPGELTETSWVVFDGCVLWSESRAELGLRRGGLPPLFGLWRGRLWWSSPTTRKALGFPPLRYCAGAPPSFPAPLSRRPPPHPSQGTGQEPAGPWGIFGARCPGARGTATASTHGNNERWRVGGETSRLVRSPCGGAETAEVARVSFPF